MKTSRFQTALMILALLGGQTVFLSSCEKDGSVEDTVEDAGDSVGDAMENAGDSIDDAVDDAGDAIDDAVDD